MRHGENKANLTKEFSYKVIDYPLTQKGILQAQQTANYFRLKSIHGIFSSPMKRALETAKIIGRYLNLEVNVEENFREINVGSFEREGYNQENWRKYMKILDQWYEGNLYAQFPEGENYITLRARMKEGFRKVIGTNYKIIIIVGHGGIFTATIKDICTDIHINDLSSANCSITKLIADLEREELVIKLLSWATTSHLHGEAADLIPGVPILDKKS